MKKAILFAGALFFLLMSNLSFAQKTTQEQKKSKTVEIEKTKSSKVGISGKKTSKITANKAEEKGIALPDTYFNSNDKNKITRIPQKLTLKNSAFQIKLNDNAINLYENGSSNAYAKLVPTQKEGLYRYTSSTINGAAHFDKQGNLVVKYLDNDTGKTKELQFQSN
ncbi:MAG: hypothetical protein ACTIJ9_10605 [Aequorivita sp.]